MLPPFSVVIPCFNEAARIGETLRLTLDYLAANAPESELIVVNDGSTDATAAIARERLKDAGIETRLLENFPNRGKGAAVRSGLLAARKPIGLFFDADLSTPLGETPKVIEPIANGEVDIAFGSRALDRGLIARSTCLCVLRPDYRFGILNAVLRRFASTFAARCLKPRASMASPSMSNCFISRSMLDCEFVRFRCAGITLRGAKFSFSRIACGCCAK